MVRVLAEVASNDGFRAGLVVTTLAFGLRHGIDWDHIAAITDITSSQDAPRQSMLFATLYALGHAVVVVLIGSLAVIAGDFLPSGVDAVMERVVGVTLLLLGTYVFWALIRDRRDFRMRSRWMLLFSTISRVSRRVRRKDVVIEHDHLHAEPHGHGEQVAVGEPVADAVPVRVETRHQHRHVHRVPMPDDPFTNYGRATAFFVGMLHGVGAETATQLVVFLAAAKAGGTVEGELLLLVFVFGLMVSNSGIALASTFGFVNATRSFKVYATVAVITGAFSLVIGAVFLFGQGGVLPAIFGG